jgi:hypothetical protein
MPVSLQRGVGFSSCEYGPGRLSFSTVIFREIRRTPYPEAVYSHASCFLKTNRQGNLTY